MTVMQPISPIIPKITNPPTFPLLPDGTQPDDNANATSNPAKVGARPFETLPPSVDRPFIVPRCDGITVRFVATAMLEKNTIENTRQDAKSKTK